MSVGTPQEQRQHLTVTALLHLHKLSFLVFTLTSLTHSREPERTPIACSRRLQEVRPQPPAARLPGRGSHTHTRPDRRAQMHQTPCAEDCTRDPWMSGPCLSPRGPMARASSLRPDSARTVALEAGARSAERERGRGAARAAGASEICASCDLREASMCGGWSSSTVTWELMLPTMARISSGRACGGAGAAEKLRLPGRSPGMTLRARHNRRSESPDADPSNGPGAS